MIKKVLITALAALSLGCTQSSANQVTTISNDMVEIETFPSDDLESQTSFEHNGLKYTLSSDNSLYTVTKSDNASTITDLVLPSHIFDLPVDYQSLDVSTYTSLERVIINQNYSGDMWEILKDVPNEFDVYLTGQYIFSEDTKICKIKDLYLVSPYYGDDSYVVGETNLGFLSESSIKHIYAYKYKGLEYFVYNGYKLDNMNITNADGTVLKITYVSENQLAYPLEAFYPFEGFTVKPMYLGAEGYNQVKDTTNDGLVKDKIYPYISSLDERVEVLYIGTKNFTGDDLPSKLKTLVVADYNGQSFLNNTGNEIIIYNSYEEDFNFNYVSGFKTIRFTKTLTKAGHMWTGLGLNAEEVASIEKIYIPEQYKTSHYNPIYTCEEFEGRVETYDHTTYTIPTMSSFKSNNGKVYQVQDQSLTLAYLETGIELMTAEGKTPSTNTPVDVQIAAFYRGDDVEVETPEVETDYSIREVKGIYLPKTFHVGEVSNFLKLYLLMKNDEAVSEDYTINFNYPTLSNKENFTLTLTGTYPDEVEYTSEVPVYVTSDDVRVAYVLFNDNTLVAVTYQADELTQESLKTNMENYISNTLKIEATNVVFTEGFEMTEASTYTGVTYGEDYEVIIINTDNEDVILSSSDKPVDQEQDKEDYAVAGNIYFTSNYSLEDVIKAISNKVLYQNGIKVSDEYQVKATYNTKTITWTILVEDEEVYTCETSYKKVKDSQVGNFIYADITEYETSILLLEKGTDSKFEDIYNHVLVNYAEVNEEALTEVEVDLSKVNETTITAVYEHTDKNFFEHQMQVYVVDLVDEIKDSTAEITKDKLTFDELVDNVKDGMNDWFNDFKTKFEENKAVKTASIIIGTITGVLLIYGVYLLIRKFIKWLK